MSDFLKKFRVSSETLYRVNTDLFDLEENQRDRSCLGTAVISASMAVQFTAVGMKSESIEYFFHIKSFAEIAYSNDENYVYANYDGQNYFGKYMAKRLEGISAWVLGKNDWQQHLASSASLLEQAFYYDIANSGTNDAIAGYESPGHLCLALCSAEKWQSVAKITGKYSPASHTSDWANITGIIGRILQKIDEEGNLFHENLTTELDEFFRKRILKRPGSQKTLDPVFSNLDLLEIAKFRSWVLSPSEEPVNILTTLRNFI